MAKSMSLLSRLNRLKCWWFGHQPEQWVYQRIAKKGGHKKSKDYRWKCSRCNRRVPSPLSKRQDTSSPAETTFRNWLAKVTFRTKQ